jgi:hypothetical protein
VELVWQFAGALGILVPFALYQLGRMSPHGVAYLAPNLVGSAILTVIAWRDAQWGFLLVQAVWTLAAGWGLARRSARRRSVPGRSVPGRADRPD